VDRWKEFRENRKQLRCCNWIQLPNRQSPDISVVKAGRRRVVIEHSSNARSPPEARSQNISSICSHSRRRVCGPARQNFFVKKKNEGSKAVTARPQASFRWICPGACRKAFGLFFTTRDQMKNHISALFLGALLAPLGVVHAQDNFADQVISYSAGTGINSSFETASAALGMPVSSATITAPPFLNTDLVGVGNGGQLTLAFNTPITNNSAGHAGGMDFTIFGNEFFTISGSTISGIFNHPGLTVWVSQDNVTYYELAAPHGADDLYPTEGSGNAFLPVNPSLTLASFTGQTSAQALSLYNGSAGGASYSISWAEDGGGNAVNLPSISYVKVEGTSGFGYVDAISRVQDVPEPSGAGLVLAGVGMLLGRRRWRGSLEGKNGLADESRVN
jgi:hypothetical protein